ncbi:MAG: DUF2442 domain-containing protein [Thermoguttaceae bacterium]
MSRPSNPDVQQVVAQNDFTLLLTFTNGERRIFDVKPMMDRGYFRELQNIGYFRCVRVDSDGFGCVEWPHEQDIGPDTLYHGSVPLK